MEYVINNEINSPNLQIRSILVKKKKLGKAQKGHRRKSPQGGWGMGSKDPNQKNNFINSSYNIRELI